MEKKEEKINVAATLKAMKVGEKKTFPIERGQYVKNVASQRGFIWGMTFTTSNNRLDRTVIVTRIS